MTTDNFCFYLQNRLIQTSQTGGQWYSDTSFFSIPWYFFKKVWWQNMDFYCFFRSIRMQLILWWPFVHICTFPWSNSSAAVSTKWPTSKWPHSKRRKLADSPGNDRSLQTFSTKPLQNFAPDEKNKRFYTKWRLNKVRKCFSLNRPKTIFSSSPGDLVI